MILIKDRHWNMYQQMVSFQIGKYDTYKGSTPSFKSSALKLKDSGKYDTYKGSTRTSWSGKCTSGLFGKYDTYKGSTHISVWRRFNINFVGNMILIKDRHSSIFLLSTIYIGIRLYCHFYTGKYDTYKGSTPG